MAAPAIERPFSRRIIGWWSGRPARVGEPDAVTTGWGRTPGNAAADAGGRPRAACHGGGGGGAYGELVGREAGGSITVNDA
jgi:hypothetical protein